MKFVIVSQYIYPFDLGGTEVAMYNLASTLKKKGHEVTVITRKTNCKEFKTVFKVFRVKTINLPVLNIITFFASSLFFLFKEDYEVLISIPVRPHGILGVIIALFKRKVITITWGRGKDIYDANAWEKPLIALIFKQSSLVFALTPEMKCMMKKICPKKEIIVIPNGVAISVEKEFYKDPPNFIYVGRLTKRKRVDLLIKAFHKSGLHLKTNLLIVGWGPEYKHLKNLTKKLEVENIVFFGKQPHERIKSLLERSEVFVIPSLYEGLSNAVLEAMASCLPIVTFKDNSSSKLLCNEENGWLVKENSSDALAKVLDRVSKSDTIKKKGINAKKYVNKNYSLNLTVDMLLSAVIDQHSQVLNTNFLLLN